MRRDMSTDRRTPIAPHALAYTDVKDEGLIVRWVRRHGEEKSQKTRKGPIFDAGRRLLTCPIRRATINGNPTSTPTLYRAVYGVVGHAIVPRV